MKNQPSMAWRQALAGATLLSAMLGTASAQERALNATEQLGRQFYMTSCGLCHANPDLVNKAPGPILSGATLNGKAEDIAAFIKVGTNTMPSFSVTYSDAEIDAIAKYIVTIPAKEAAK